MPAEREILKYELDTSQAEQKAQELQALLEQITQGRARGEDVSGLERQLGREVSALGKLTGAETKAAGATGELIKKKDQLGGVVRLLGGRFSGLLGDAGGVLELFLALGAAAGPLAAGLAGITLAVKAWRDLNEQLRNTEQLLKDIKSAESQFTGQQSGAFQRISESLKQAGGFSGQNAERAFGLFRGSLAAGVPESAAAELAGVGFSAGLSAQDVALLAAAGKSPATPQEAQADIAAIRADPHALAEIQAAAARNAASREGRQARFSAGLIGRQFQRDPRFGEKLAGTSQDAVLFERAVGLGLLKPDARLDRIDELRSELAQLAGERDSLQAQLDAVIARQAQPVFQIGRLNLREIEEQKRLGKRPFIYGERARLQTERVNLLSRLNRNGLDARRLEALQPLGDSADILRKSGVPDSTGPVTDVVGPFAPGSDDPLGFSERTRGVLGRLPSQAPATGPAAPRVGDFTVPAAELVGPPAPTTQPATVNYINIGTLIARPGRGWIKRGGKPGFGTGNVPT